MNTYKRPRGNKAKRDKDSILADAKNLLYILYSCIQRMPKIERIEGAPMEMKCAANGIIESFSIAKECPEVRLQEIHKMFGCYGRLLANFDLCIVQGLMTDSDWWQWIDWDYRRLCVISKPQHTFRQRLCKKYYLKLRSI